MKNIPFTKMHGLGNDFVLINTHELPVKPQDLPVAQLADRNTGIGFDQLLLITPKQKVEEFYCQIFNADGSEAEQCGNGLRCVARYVREQGLYDQSDLVISTVAGSYPVHIEDYEHITVRMGAPSIKEKLLSMPSKTGGDVKLSIVDLGNPHAVINMTEITGRDAKVLAEEIANFVYFKHGANVGFMEVLNKNHVRLRTFERGAGETRACGSNACAAAVAGIANGWIHSPVQVEFKDGKLDIVWEGGDNTVTMTGPAVRVFSGILE